MFFLTEKIFFKALQLYGIFVKQIRQRDIFQLYLSLI